MNRRSLLLGIGSLIAAPAVVRAESLMKVMVLRESVRRGAVASLVDPRRGTDFVVFDGLHWRYARPAQGGNGIGLMIDNPALTRSKLTIIPNAIYSDVLDHRLIEA